MLLTDSRDDARPRCTMRVAPRTASFVSHTPVPSRHRHQAADVASAHALLGRRQDTRSVLTMPRRILLFSPR